MSACELKQAVTGHVYMWDGEQTHTINVSGFYQERMSLPFIAGIIHACMSTVSYKGFRALDGC